MSAAENDLVAARRATLEKLFALRDHEANVERAWRFLAELPEPAAVLVHLALEDALAQARLEAALSDQQRLQEQDKKTIAQELARLGATDFIAFELDDGVVSFENAVEIVEHGVVFAIERLTTLPSGYSVERTWESLATSRRRDA